MSNKDFQNFIATAKYCRWNPDENRRETWEEAVDRYMNYMIARFNVPSHHLEETRSFMKRRLVFGSMRALMTAGKALDLDDVAAYNCSYIAVKSPRDFSNIMYILMCGTGVGFSCEEMNVKHLPKIPDHIVKDFDKVITVEDSRQGWANAIYEFISALFSGYHVRVDTSLIRPAGARLKTFGGYASGPEPFKKLIKFVSNTFLTNQGKKLEPIQVHDIVCQIAEIVICGGVRRSALISLSDRNDMKMALAKSGPWWEINSYRSLSNNSAVYYNRPTLSEFIHDWHIIFDSRSGERGFCNRGAMTHIASLAGRDTEGIEFGTNPCSEIILRPNQFCNLSTIAVMHNDSLMDLEEKIRMATILGTLQSGLTDFKYFKEIGDDSFRKNCEEERLLGVSMTGILDHPVLNGSMGKDQLRYYLQKLKKVAKETNLKWADMLGINKSMSITCIKPEGTTSCVAGTSSGLHPRYSEYYIRRVRLDIKEPICQFMIDSGFINEPCIMRPETTMVFSFPIKSPNTSIFQDDLKALEHLDLWLEYQIYYCDHKPSITVTYRDEEFMEVGGWVYNNFDMLSGVSFLPHSDHVYQQAPFEKISSDEYYKMLSQQPVDVDWSGLSNYEFRDTTKNSHTLACTANGCEVT